MYIYTLALIETEILWAYTHYTILIIAHTFIDVSTCCLFVFIVYFDARPSFHFYWLLDHWTLSGQSLHYIDQALLHYFLLLQYYSLKHMCTCTWWMMLECFQYHLLYTSGTIMRVLSIFALFPRPLLFLLIS